VSGACQVVEETGRSAGDRDGSGMALPSRQALGRWVLALRSDGFGCGIMVLIPSEEPAS
jgi:hypothetical protein